jgi:hypothetical protein
MAYLLARESRDWEWLFEFNAKVRAMYWSDLATAIFRPFRAHGVIYGKMSLHMLEQFSERLTYFVGQLSRKDIYSYAQVTLKRNWRGSVYIHYRLPDKKALNFGYYLFQMTQGRLERFDESPLDRFAEKMKKWLEEDGEPTLETIKKLSSPTLRKVLEKVWNAGYEYGFLDGEVGI